MFRRLFMLLALGAPFIVAPTVRGAGACTSNQDCPEGYYCRKAPGGCDSKGECAVRPTICPDVWAPVCGCDGRTYGNDCEAAAAGVNVLYGGQCKPPPCWNTSGCGPGYYCLKAPGDCDGKGQCFERPTRCQDIQAPVCGCDGRTYSNACYAARAGVSVDHAGPCVTPCRDNNDCDGGYFCRKNDGDCDGTGLCAARPEICPEVWDPICGCDGRTYQNSCFAAMEGVNTDYKGVCIQTFCTDNNACDPNFYCRKEPGACDSRGLCRERPELCPPLWDPVCGCDGVTYANACSAAMAGVNVGAEGPCPVICTNNIDCGGVYYCRKEPGDCGGEGLCSELPEACPDIWEPVCGCNGHTYDNSCYAAMAGVSVDFAGECPPPGPKILMVEPRAADDDVHTGASGLKLLRILWSEAVVFEADDVTVIDQDNALVGFAAAGSGSEIMRITFKQRLLHDRYTIVIGDSAYGLASGLPIDGDENGAARGEAIVIIEHRKRGDLDNNNLVNFADLALWAESWLAEL
ncbi:MAG: hypothetical protein JSU94_20735 [Phycisphaerales bacterium]|nr:MAG: hypothetical protein JSU94_20735 [Phycisphaerales bacterium]